MVKAERTPTAFVVPPEFAVRLHPLYTASGSDLRFFDWLREEFIQRLHASTPEDLRTMPLIDGRAVMAIGRPDDRIAFASLLTEMKTSKAALVHALLAQICETQSAEKSAANALAVAESDA